MIRAVTCLVLLSVALPAQAGTVAVAVEGTDEEVPRAAVESMLWHALYDRHGHDAVLVDRETAAAEMRDAGLTTLVEVRVAWGPLTARLPAGGRVGSVAPHIEVVESVRHGDLLVPYATWTAQGALALFDERQADGSTAVVALPEISLQEALAVAMGPVQPPTWQADPERLDIPIVVVADEEYRGFYGAGWKAEADLRISRASALLAQAGLRLDVVAHGEWRSDDTADGLSALLDDLAQVDEPHPTAIRVAFTQQTGLARAAPADVEDVGRAYRPGRDVIVADQAAVPGHSTAWDIAEEGSAVAHEILHALGVPHLDERHLLMSGRKASTVHRLAPGTQALALAAARARWTPGDAWTAVADLSSAAEAWLFAGDDRLDYVAGNLLAGPGAPAPNGVEPTRLSALTNAAVGRVYLALAEADPDNEGLWQRALVHSEAAVAQDARQTPLLVEVLDARRLLIRSE